MSAENSRAREVPAKTRATRKVARVDNPFFMVVLLEE
jgi:hypothetical protein